LILAYAWLKVLSLVSLGLGSFLMAQATKHAPVPKPRWPVAVIAHRCGGGIAPENTLAALRQAIRLKVDYVEIDVRTTKDGALVNMHDSTVDRMTNGRGAVRDLTLAEIRALEVKTRFGPEFDHQKVPTLDEILEIAKGKVNIYLDHKDSDVAATLAVIRRHGMERQVVVYNDPAELLKWKRQAPRVPVMPSLPDPFRRAGGIAQFEKTCPAEVLDGSYTTWTRELVGEAHAAGVKVYADIQGKTDNTEHYERAIAMGIDGLQTDYPDRLIAYLRARKQSSETDRFDPR
jgi:glycerophosphoryl diester phosphodiesterase